MLADTDMVGIRVRPSLRPHYTGLSLRAYPRAYAWAHYKIMKVVVMQPVTIFATLDYVIQDEIIVHPYDGTLLRRPELTIAKGQLRMRCWF